MIAVLQPGFEPVACRNSSKKRYRCVNWLFRSAMIPLFVCLLKQHRRPAACPEVLTLFGRQVAASQSIWN
jgi:hypothetical protein